MKQKIYEIIFGTETRGGRSFDIVLLFLILLSVLVIMFESIPGWRDEYTTELFYAEWIFTIVFSIEYLLRIIVSPKPFSYMKSKWGLIDLISILPTFVNPFISGYTSIRVVRALRLLRIFRILKLSRFTTESKALGRALNASYYKIMVFLFFVVMMMIITGTLMYVIEGGQNGFESIPASIYWAVVTTTTVGYGDIIPVTVLGKMLSSLMMIVGYAIIAVPTGVISVEIAKNQKSVSLDEFKDCSNCGKENDSDAMFCKNCGNKLV